MLKEIGSLKKLKNNRRTISKHLVLWATILEKNTRSQSKNHGRFRMGKLSQKSLKMKNSQVTFPSVEVRFFWSKCSNSINWKYNKQLMAKKCFLGSPSTNFVNLYTFIYLNLTHYLPECYPWMSRFSTILYQLPGMCSVRSSTSRIELFAKIVIGWIYAYDCCGTLESIEIKKKIRTSQVQGSFVIAETVI